MHSELTALKEQLNRILIGKEDKITLVLAALLARGHVLLEDVPGVGKTTLANGLARSIDASYGRKTKSVILMDTDHVILSALTPETLTARMTGQQTDEIEEEENV